MRVLPHMRVIVPADGVEADQAVRAAAATPGPFYVRLSRASTPVIFDSSYKFEIGKGALLREGGDVCLAACGVASLRPWKPQKSWLARASKPGSSTWPPSIPWTPNWSWKSAQNCGAILTVEEHQIRGGLGDAVAQQVVRHHPVPMDYLGMDDEFGQSGTAGELLEHYGLSAKNIAARAESLIQRKA